jgi:hypothetical protein
MTKQSNVLSPLIQGLCILLLLQHVACSKYSSPSETKKYITFDPSTVHYFVPPDSISVKPVFFVPKGEADTTTDQKSSLIRHLKMGSITILNLVDQPWYIFTGEELSDIQRQTHLEFLQTTSGEWRSTIRK